MELLKYMYTWMVTCTTFMQAFSFENTRRAKNDPCRIK